MATTKNQADPTFRNYTATSAQSYAKNRRGYPDELISLVIDRHTSSGGRLDVLLDLGCGPGTATRSLAPRFRHAVGADPGRSMIETARTVPCVTASGEPTTFVVCASDSISSIDALKRFSSDGTTHNTVDLITAGTSAHWFDFPDFYVEASKILRPGGSIIMWCTKGYYVDERTTPNAAKLQQLWQDFEDVVLKPYEMEGNRLTRGLYADLPLPWSEYPADENLDDQGRALLGAFQKSEFSRQVFNDGGHIGPDGKFLMSRRATFEQSRAMLGTASPVTRWREAHKEQLERGEVEDLVDKVFRESVELLEEVPEGRGRDWVEGGSAVVVMTIKKKKESA
ncbi:hypothetical protein, variant [Exophiala oligosperma]|uniref:Methyltransferase type 11 domain-containing protein n=1 Tax=Exophiala oligosperma TaxID=215243 RepID=A0A0D2EAV9_9EURO|nr:uncharacterized protein PV06_03518 [Exophiala oligosperma]XP_016265320.1 hypothetical protein, variant [Exophiala oligosperma]KIW45103.1 hypothetical protein PV06_03518 [Exophiala oligosperma]KIW45104.1 hypothetical protein, variant [Exophiala oligosperma]